SAKRVCVPNLNIAIRWFKQHAKELGVDPNRIVAGGLAAGTSACWAPRTDRNSARIVSERTRLGDTLSLNSTSSRIITSLAKDS
ncbi:alpha/beta hydrolase, partial [bacterium]|nr:alpha/beta hydrolase [bacterium]